MNKIEVKIGNKTYNLLVAETEEEKVIGLSTVDSLPEDEGMLFDYSDEPEDELSFTMEDTKIPLDIIFINPEGIVISNNYGEPFSEEYITESNGPIACVIEVNANSGIKSGDKTDLFEELEDEDDPNLNVNKLYIYGSDGEVQGELVGGERIFSRKSSRIIVRKAKKAFKSKSDTDYKALGRYVFNEMKAQDDRPDEYVKE